MAPAVLQALHHFLLYRYLDPGNNAISASQFYPRGAIASYSQGPQPNDPALYAASGQPMATFELLQSISITMSNVQTKLTTIEERTQQHDKAFDQIEEALQTLKKSHSNCDQARMTKYKSKSHKSPRGLSVRKNMLLHVHYTYMYVYI